MRVNEKHHKMAEAFFKDGHNTPQTQKMLMENGLTKSQANSCCRTARKHLGLYKPYKKTLKERAKKEANQQSQKRTEVEGS